MTSEPCDRRPAAAPSRPDLDRLFEAIGVAPVIVDAQGQWRTVTEAGRAWLDPRPEEVGWLLHALPVFSGDAALRLELGLLKLDGSELVAPERAPPAPARRGALAGE